MVLLNHKALKVPGSMPEMVLEGEAVVGGAVTVVNAIPTGRGAALGIGLRTRARVRLIEGESGVRFLDVGRVGDDRVVRATVEVVLDWAGTRGVGCEVDVISEVPVAVGLKSSSAAASAVAFALFDALGVLPAPEEALRLIAEASLRSGTSVTGAADDAAACFMGGFVVTDNAAKALLRREGVGGDIVAVVSVPKGRRTYTSEFRREILDPFRPAFDAAFDLALRGDLFGAMTVNGLAMSAALGYGAEFLAEAMRRGARSCSISGTGPAMAALVSRSDSDAVSDALSDYGEVMVVGLNNRPASLGSGRSWP
ncbi:MAG: shikimate kinase [Candidatus Caldarchaeales archaeon]